MREIGAFGVVGISGVAVDLGIFQLCYAHLGLGAVSSRAVSTSITMVLAYLAHRHWSFADRDTRAHRSYAVFVAVNLGTLGYSLAAVALARHGVGITSSGGLQAVNLFTIASGTVIRYLSYRAWVFVAPRTVGAQVPEVAA